MAKTERKDVMAETGQAETNAVVAELIAIKKLLILALAKGTESKMPQLTLARVLGIGQASVSRMISPPKRRPSGKGKGAPRAR